MAMYTVRILSATVFIKLIFILFRSNSCSVDMYGGSTTISVNIGEEHHEKVIHLLIHNIISTGN